MYVPEPRKRDLLWAAILPMRPVDYKGKEKLFKALEKSVSNRNLWRIHYIIGELNGQDQKRILNTVTSHGNKDLILFTKHFAKIDLKKHGDTALKIACERSDFMSAKVFLNNDVSPNVLDGAPLMAAIEKNRIDIVRLLLKHGAKTNLNPKDSWYKEYNVKAHPHDLFLTAIEFNRSSIVELMLENKSDARAHNDKALFHAAAIKSDKIYDLLIEHGCEPNNIKKWCDIYKNTHDKLNGMMMYPDPQKDYARRCFTQEKHAQDFIKMLAAKEQKRHKEIQIMQKTSLKTFQLYFSSKMKIEHCRKTIDEDGTNWFMLSAKAGEFHSVLNTLIKNGEAKKLSLSDITSTDQHGLSALDYMFQTDTLSDILHPQIWGGRIEQFNDFWKTLPKKYQAQANLKKFKQDLNILSIHKNSRSPRKPKR